MTSRERQYLLDVLIAAEDALSFVRGRTFDEFVSNTMLRNAVLHSLTIMGEAAGRIPDESEAELPSLPWRKMKNLRNVIVHEYEGLNYSRIWHIVTVEVPTVLAALQPVFPERTA